MPSAFVCSVKIITFVKIHESIRNLFPLQNETSRFTKGTNRVIFGHDNRQSRNL